MRRHRLLIGIYSFYLLLGGVLIASVTRTDFHLYINQFHDWFFDIFFKYATKLGEPLAIGGIILLCSLIYHTRAGFYLLLTNIINLVLVLALKQLVFDNVDRPRQVFKGIAELYYVPGVDVHIYNSFPSGHTAGAFATFTALILLTSRPLVKWLWFGLAIIVGLSRMYLSQHFFIDVYFGSIIGVLVAVLTYLTYYRRKKDIIT